MSVLEKIRRGQPSYKKTLTIEELKVRNINIKNISMKDKKNVKILIIDDQGFDTTRLERLGYIDIRKVDSFSRMEDLEIYDIILCDINGVAKDIDIVYQGAALAKMIKETYPTKIVVIFSAKPQKANFFKYFQDVDDFMVKNIQISDLSEKLNKYILKLNNPIEIWESTKERLNKHHIASKTIALMEHYYVKSIIDNKDYSDQMIHIESGISEELLKKILSGACELIKLYIEFSSKIGV